MITKTHAPSLLFMPTYTLFYAVWLMNMVGFVFHVFMTKNYPGEERTIVDNNNCQCVEQIV
jgi:hypothetical protein